MGPQSRRVVGDVTAVLGVLLLVGLVAGVVWTQLVTPATFTKTAQGGSMGEDELSKAFRDDGWYSVVAGVAGLVCGLGLSWWRRRDPLLSSGLLVVGSALAAGVMAVVGRLLGPGDPGAALAAARVGARVPQQLHVDSTVVYLVWPVAVLAGALFVLLGRSPDEDDRRSHADDRVGRAGPGPDDDPGADAAGSTPPGLRSR